jgi:hypothetical protein
VAPAGRRPGPRARQSSLLAKDSRRAQQNAEFADRVAGLHLENRLIPIESVIDARYNDGGIFRNTSLALAFADGSQLTFRWIGLWMLLPEIEQIALVNQPFLMRVMFGDRLTIE